MDGMELDNRPVLARQCAVLVGSSPGELYKMARLGLIPVQRVGVRGRGVRFIPREVKAALTARPAWERTSAR